MPSIHDISTNVQRESDKLGELVAYKEKEYRKKERRTSSATLDNLEVFEELEAEGLALLRLKKHHAILALVAKSLIS